MKNLLFPLCLTVFILLGNTKPTMSSETITLAYDSNVRPTPCSTTSLGKIKEGTLLEVSKKALVWSGAIRTQWFEVSGFGQKGWVSDQNTTKPIKPVFDKSGLGKKCRYEVE